MLVAFFDEPDNEREESTTLLLLASVRWLPSRGDGIGCARYSDPHCPLEAAAHPSKDGTLSARLEDVVVRSMRDVDGRGDAEASVGASGGKARAAREELEDGGAVRGGRGLALRESLAAGEVLIQASPIEALAGHEHAVIGEA